MKSLFIVIATLLIISHPMKVDAYDNKYVHKAINKNATDQSSLGNILTFRLGYSNGLKALFKMGKAIPQGC